MTAVETLARLYHTSVVKTVRFRQTPTPTELKQQLAILRAKLRKISVSPRKMKITMELRRVERPRRRSRSAGTDPPGRATPPSAALCRSVLLRRRRTPCLLRMRRATRAGCRASRSRTSLVTLPVSCIRDNRTEPRPSRNGGEATRLCNAHESDAHREGDDTAREHRRRHARGRPPPLSPRPGGPSHYTRDRAARTRL
jgi:hypothetical protein